MFNNNNVVFGLSGLQGFPISFPNFIVTQSFEVESGSN